jgi:O-antigen/teichoic acid export membrane protein
VAEAARDASDALASVARGGLANLVGAAVAATTGFALVAVVGKLVDQRTAGELFTATSAFLILLGVASLGSSTGLARFTLRYLAQGRAGELRELVRAARTPVVVTSVALGVALLVAAEDVAGRLGLHGTAGVRSVQVLAVLLPLAALSELGFAGTQAFGRMRVTVVADRVGRSIVQAVAVLVAAEIGADVLGLTVSWVAPYALTAVVATLALSGMVRRAASVPAPRRAVAREVRREYWSFTWARSIAQVLQIVLQRADIVLVAMLLSPVEAAVYTVATRFVPLGQFAANAIQQALQPRISELLAGNATQEAERVFRVSTAWGVLATWPVYTVVAAASAQYLTIFGDGYRTGPAQLVVVLMAGAMMLGSAFGTLDTMLLMAGRSTTSLTNASAALVVDVGLCLALIPPLGIVGAAVAWAASVVVRNLLGLWQVRRTLGVSPFGRAWAVATAANLVCFALPLGVATAAGASAGVIALLGAAGLAAYLTALAVFRRRLAMQYVVGAVTRRGSRPGRGSRPTPGSAADHEQLPTT